jgi:hypothetical protein
MISLRLPSVELSEKVCDDAAFTMSESISTRISTADPNSMGFDEDFVLISQIYLGLQVIIS